MTFTSTVTSSLTPSETTPTEGGGDVNQNIDGLGGSQTSVVGGIDGDVIGVVVEALAVVGVYDVTEVKVIAVVFTGSYVRTVAGVARCTVSL